MSTSLLSAEFLGISLLAIVLVGAFRGALRQLLFLTLNLVFLGAVVLEPRSAAATLGFCLLGYVAVRVVVWRGRLFAPVIAAYALLFVYLRSYELLELLLPEDALVSTLSTVGLSFLLFKILHIMIEGRSGTLGTFSFGAYLNYCLNFTTFLMGPIQRYQDYSAQWSGERDAIAASYEAHLDAGLRVLLGFVKAYVVAAWLEPHALRPDTNLLALSGTSALFATYAFYFYLYLNFSGYCDVVIGVGSLMGVRPPENFDKPFLARNISDFWLRQHRSLTTWLTDYVFTPTYKRALESPGLRRRPLLAASGALMLTMLVSGLWHGTTLPFLLFGLVHGLYLVVYRGWDTLLTRRLGRAGVRHFRSRPLVHAGGVLLTFHAAAFAFVFFRIDTPLWLGMAAQLGLR